MVDKFFKMIIQTLIQGFITTATVPGEEIAVLKIELRIGITALSWDEEFCLKRKIKNFQLNGPVAVWSEHFKKIVKERYSKLYCMCLVQNQNFSDHIAALLHTLY